MEYWQTNMIKNKISVYRYHDYRRYFSDVIKANKAQGLTLRKFAQLLKISPAYLSQVISGKKDFSTDLLSKFKTSLRLDKNEMSHLIELLSLSRSENQKEKIDIFNKIVKDKKYQNSNPDELEAYSYLSHWYFVALKEYLAIVGNDLKSYQQIKSDFIYKIKDSEIKKAIKFLVEENFIEFDADGNLKVIKSQVDCYSDIYRLSLSHFHKQMFNLAIEAIHFTARDKRLILGNTVSLSKEGFKKVNEIIETAHHKIAEIEQQDKNKANVYHVGLAFFPLTNRVGGKNE